MKSKSIACISDQGSKSTRAAQSMSLGDAGAKLSAMFDFEAASVGLVRSEGAGAGVLAVLRLFEKAVDWCRRGRS